jgi:hypothetical protein
MDQDSATIPVFVGIDVAKGRLDKPTLSRPQDDVSRLLDPSPWHAIRARVSAIDRFPNRKPPRSRFLATAE